MEETNSVNFPFLEFDKIDTVIWDWNGTLLDDVEVNLKVINQMLLKRSLPQLTITTYRDLFCFPVQSFQIQIGFDFSIESMQDISQEYHAIYQSYEKEIGLNSEARFVLDEFCQKGIEQYILSASQRDYLTGAVSDFDLTDKFKAIYGISDICAAGKIELGKELIRNHSLDPERTVIVGDTLHDAKVAKILGVNCILYAGGHNSHTLLAEEAPVITMLQELV